MSQKLSRSYLDWLNALELHRPPHDITDLADGSALFEVLSRVDPTYFRNPRTTESKPSDNWVLRSNTLKRMYKLVMRYYEDVLHHPPTALSILPVPDLQLIAKSPPPASTPSLSASTSSTNPPSSSSSADGTTTTTGTSATTTAPIAAATEPDDQTITAINQLCSMVLTLCVQSEHARADHVEKIRGLEEWEQGELMRVIEDVIAQIQRNSGTQNGTMDAAEATIAADDEYYLLQSDRSRLAGEMETLQSVNERLLKQYNDLKDDHEEAIRNLNSQERQLDQARKEVDDLRNAERGDHGLRLEVDRLKDNLRSTENELGAAEGVVDKQTKVIEDMTKRIEDLNSKAEEATRLKDQMDEYKHAADKLQKMENVIEKYKKKLEEGADLRRSLKQLEDQNIELLDKNSVLEDEYRKVSAFKPLMEQYKNQIADLETRAAKTARENDALKYELDRTQDRLRIAEEEKEKEGEVVMLYEERVKELETETGAPRRRKPRAVDVEDGEMDDSHRQSAIFGIDGVGGELDDAITGTTMTDLKLKIRKLTKDLDEARRNKADSSRIVVLENLLEDSNRMKNRYEGDYLREHREHLVAKEQLEAIRSGKSAAGDGPEAAIALRQRLNETVEELEKVKRELTEITVRFEYVNNELTVAKSNLNLVNKDQLEILGSLRDQVSVEKVGLQKELDKAREEMKVLDDKTKMQMSQINNLLLERVDSQMDSIGQREAMLDKERDLGLLKENLARKGISPQDQARIDDLAEENKASKQQIKSMEDKLHKAKQFIKQQEKLFKKEKKDADASESKASWEQAEEHYKAEINQLKEDLHRSKENNETIESNYRKEQALMLQAWHRLGMQNIRDSVSTSSVRPSAGGSRGGSSSASWLAQQRSRANKNLRT